jgi:hypothetical protein
MRRSGLVVGQEHLTEPPVAPLLALGPALRPAVLSGVISIFPKAFGMPLFRGAYMAGSSSPRQTTITSTWVVDQIENGVAAVEIDGKSTITLPLGVLPRGVREGDVLLVTISQDPAEQARRLARSAAQVLKGGTGGKGNIIL